MKVFFAKDICRIINCPTFYKTRWIILSIFFYVEISSCLLFCFLTQIQYRFHIFTILIFVYFSSIDFGNFTIFLICTKSSINQFEVNEDILNILFCYFGICYFHSNWHPHTKTCFFHSNINFWLYPTQIVATVQMLDLFVWRLKRHQRLHFVTELLPASKEALIDCLLRMYDLKRLEIVKTERH